MPGKPRKIGPARSKSDSKNIKNDYIALMDLDFSWSWPKITLVRKLWIEGYEIAEIAEEVDRIIDEVALLIMDQARKGKLNARPGGVFGSEKFNGKKKDRRSA
jgi:hypothetical protein